jgi:proteasome assembly chaperone (PAC2) family protein
MRVGAFQIDEPIPELRSPHAFAVLRPWIDVGKVGSATINILESTFNAQPLGRLIKPGNFFDFTRYRPIVRLVDNERNITVPNAYINFVKQSEGNDLVFFHLLEPHMHGEMYVESILKVLQILGIRRYCLLGGMHDAVPHTKPLIISGTASGELKEKLLHLGVKLSDYEGPSTIVILVSKEAPKHDIEVMSLIVHVPQYTQLDDDLTGQLFLLRFICSLYNFPIALENITRKAEEQYRKVSQAIESEPQLKQVVLHLETLYESRADKLDKDMPRLSPEVEKFLQEIDRGFSQN